MKENKIWNDYLPEDMQEHWTVYECLKESEDSSTFLAVSYTHLTLPTNSPV